MSGAPAVAFAVGSNRCFSGKRATAEPYGSLRA
jgi:hypothetical protein